MKFPKTFGRNRMTMRIERGDHEASDEPQFSRRQVSPSGGGADNASEVAALRFVTQATAPSPDYRVLLQEPALKADARRTREAALPAPPDAKAVGEVWLARLTERGALLGYGLSDRGPDSPVAQIDTGLTEEEFDRWTRDNGWTSARHIRWSFVPAMNLPSVSAAARNAIRFWPASTARTGVQHQALFHGWVELRDGCFFVSQFGQPADKLAWFHAEIGLDVDADGYVILRNRLNGQRLARLGRNELGLPSHRADRPGC